MNTKCGIIGTALCVLAIQAMALDLSWEQEQTSESELHNHTSVHERVPGETSAESTDLGESSRVGEIEQTRGSEQEAERERRQQLEARYNQLLLTRRELLESFERLTEVRLKMEGAGGQPSELEPAPAPSDHQLSLDQDALEQSANLTEDELEQQIELLEREIEMFINYINVLIQF